MRWFALLGGSGFAAAIGVTYYNSPYCFAYDTNPIASRKKYMETVPEHLNLTYKFQLFPVVEIREPTHDTKIISFGLGENQKFHLDAAQTLQCGVYDYGMGKRITRLYTPITPNNTSDKFDIMVKKYDNGYMSPKLHDLEVGQAIEWALVPPSFSYKPNMFKTMYMIAGGVGITPMLQLIRTVLADPKDKTEMKLLFCNKEEKDIILKEELDELQTKYPERFKVVYSLDKPPEGWTGEKGFVTQGMVQRALTSKPVFGDKMFVCGSDRMLTHIAGNPPAMMSPWSGKQKYQPCFQGSNNLPPVGGVLGPLGWDTENTWRF